jgi:6-phosphogluconolactonase (cycloisomerase 2 family)
MTNTSTVGANNLSYTVESNTTNAAVTINPNGAGNNCTSIAAGSSCVFTASIESGSNPGSFTVLASGTASGSSLKNLWVKAKTTVGIKSDFTAAVNVTIGLVSIPTNSYQLYLLPTNQTLNTSTESQSVLFSVLIESTTTAPLNLTNADGTTLSPSPVLISPTPSSGIYVAGSVATFSVSYLPSAQTGTSLLVANSASCSGNNCSNQASVNFVESGAGILTIAPSNVNVSPSYTTQVYTLTNTGGSNISVTLPSVSAPFSLVSNCGSSPFSLAPAPGAGSSCTYTLTYTPGATYGTESFPISYSNGLGSTVTNSFSISYIIGANIIINSAVLNPVESAGNGSLNNPFIVQPGTPNESLILTYVNNGYTDATNFSVNAGSFLSTGYAIESTTCSGIVLESNESNSCVVVLSVYTGESRLQDLSLLNNSLNASWSDMSGSYIAESINWYNSAVSQSQNAVNLAVSPPASVTAILSSSPNGSPIITSTNPNQNIYLIYTVTGGYNGQTSTYGVSLPAGMTIVGNSTCTVTVGTTMTCIIEINTGNTASGMLPFTPIPISGSIPVPVVTPSLIMQGIFVYISDEGSPPAVWVYVQDPTTGMLTSAFQESAVIPGRVTGSSGTDWYPYSVNVVGNYLYVGQAQNNVTAAFWKFSINQSNGSLTYIESLALPAQAGNNPAIYQMSTNGANAYAADYRGYLLQYQISSSGDLVFQESIPQPTADTNTPWKPQGVDSTSSNVYVADNYGTAGIWTYIIESDGSLQSANTSITTVPSMLPFGLFVSNNQYLYAPDQQANGYIWEYQIDQGTGYLNLVESLPLPGSATSWFGNSIVAINNFAYIQDDNGFIWIYNINQSTGQIGSYTGLSISQNPLKSSWQPNMAAVYMPIINISKRGAANGMVIPGDSFTISESLNYGTNYGPQTIQATLTPPDSNVTFSNNGICIVSNANPNCSITVAVGANAVYENHQIVFTNTTSGAKIATNPTEIPFTLPSFIFGVGATNGTNFNQYCTSGSCATDPESGIHGADALCQDSATTAGRSGIYKALLVSSTRYPCNASGQCGGDASQGWVLRPNYTYVNTALGPFGTTNSNGVFSSNLQVNAFYYADGVTNFLTGPSNSQFYDGIGSGLFTSNDVIGWANANVNGTESLYINGTCNDWRDTTGSFATVGGISGFSSTYPATGWISSNMLTYGGGGGYATYTMWQYGANCDAGVSYGAILCVQQPN